MTPEEGKHAPRVSFLDAVGVKSLQILCGIQPAVDDILTVKTGLSQLGFNLRGNVYLIMRRANAGRNNGDTVCGVHAEDFAHGI